jgi:hypothetical protein
VCDLDAIGATLLTSAFHHVLFFPVRSGVVYYRSGVTGRNKISSCQHFVNSLQGCKMNFAKGDFTFFASIFPFRFFSKT